MLKAQLPQKVIPAVMIGGSGTRLWPLSRSNKPKQFLSLTHGTNQSFFQQTMSRFTAPFYMPPWLMSARETLVYAEQQLDSLPSARVGGVIVEPSVQGTAAAITALAVAISSMQSDGSQAVILVAPSDHLIEDPDRFNAAVEKALPLAAQEGRIVTFGIRPTKPETGFGYIRPAAPLDCDGETCGYVIEKGGFLEKPDRSSAEKFMADGYLWNAGIFMFRADVLLQEVKKYAPATWSAAVAAVGTSTADTRSRYGPRIHLDPVTFALAPKDLPIDKAVMETSDRGAVAPCSDIGWSDIGALSSLYHCDPRKDENGNVLDDNAVVLSSSNNLIRSQSGRKIVLIGVEEMAVIDDEDVVLVARQDMAQDVKSVVRLLKENGQKHYRSVQEQIFSWGRVQITSRSGIAMVFSLILRPGARIEIQMPTTDWENWLLSYGEAEMQSGARRRRLKVGASMKPAAGEVVSLESKSASECIFTVTRHKTSAEMPAKDWDVTAEELLTILCESSTEVAVSELARDPGPSAWSKTLVAGE